MSNDLLGVLFYLRPVELTEIAVISFKVLDKPPPHSPGLVHLVVFIKNKIPSVDVLMFVGGKEKVTKISK